MGETRSRSELREDADNHRRSAGRLDALFEKVMSGHGAQHEMTRALGNRRDHSSRHRLDLLGLDQEGALHHLSDAFGNPRLQGRIGEGVRVHGKVVLALCPKLERSANHQCTQRQQQRGPLTGRGLTNPQEQVGDLVQPIQHQRLILVFLVEQRHQHILRRRYPAPFVQGSRAGLLLAEAAPGLRITATPTGDLLSKMVSNPDVADIVGPGLI